MDCGLLGARNQKMGSNIEVSLVFVAQHIFETSSSNTVQVLGICKIECKSWRERTYERQEGESAIVLRPN